MSSPRPFTAVETCRVGGNEGFFANCPGPCPNYDFYGDMLPENPAATWRRGEHVEIRWTKNNHNDGFVRLSLVPLDEMWSKQEHQRYAFYYGCWSDQEFYCNEYEKHRDCFYDRENKGYKTQVAIPSVVPDGVYVLGFTWYGGGRVFGSFGDYYDCSYVRIKGGSFSELAEATFASSGSCYASVDRLGVCDTEPCRQEHWSKPRTPAEFQHGAPTIKREWYESALRRNANKVEVAEPTDFGISRFKIMDARSEHEIHVDQDRVIWIDKSMEISIIPETFGSIDELHWYVNGKRESVSKRRPWSISGAQRNGRNSFNYYKWNYPFFDKRVYVTAIAFKGSRRAYFSKDLVFLPTRR